MQTPTSTASHVALRPVGPGDLELLVALYAAGRTRELDQVLWLPGQREAFERMQYDAQDRYYRSTYPGATFDVVEVDARPAGRLTLDRGREDVRIVDLALLPEFRGRGTGGRLIRRVLGEAAASGRTASLHVTAHNPAARLYERLGFRPVEERGPYLLLRWGVSGEDCLVAATLDRDQEKRHVADRPVAHLPRALDQALGTPEQQRELLPDESAGTVSARVGARGDLVEDEDDPVASGQPDLEVVADESGEVVKGEPVHPPTVAVPFTPRST